MPLVSPIIETAAARIPNSLYMRATDTQANIDTPELDLKEKTIVLYNNLPTVKNKVTFGVNRSWPVEIKLLELGETDDNDQDGDLIRARLIPYADMLFDAITNDERFSLIEFPTNYDLDFLGVVKIYDETLTGLNLKFNINLPRTFFCVPDPPPPQP